MAQSSSKSTQTLALASRYSRRCGVMTAAARGLLSYQLTKSGLSHMGCSGIAAQISRAATKRGQEICHNSDGWYDIPCS